MIRALTALGLLVTPAAFAQFAFEVASVRYVAPELDPAYSINVSPGSLSYTAVPLKRILAKAFEIPDFQVSGPDWLARERYTITAKWPSDLPATVVPAMLRALLAERFKLATHVEHRTVSAYDLVVGRKGHQLRPADADQPCDWYGRPGSAMVLCKSSVSDFAATISRAIAMPVFDRTMLADRFEIDVRWSTTGSEGASTLETAVQEKLGLRLQPRKASVGFVVVDSALRVPTEN